LRDEFAELRLNLMFDWNDLRYFLAVAREGSTVAAANALKVNQSTVQRRLAALEEAIGSRLVERLPAGYRLTDAGFALRPHAEAVEAAVEAFRRQIASVDTELSGAIRVTSAEGIAYLVLTPLLEKFRARYPGLKVDVILTDRMLDLTKGEADIALRAGPLRDSVLIGRKLSDVTWGLYAARAYAERHGGIQAPQDLARHSVIGFEAELADIEAARWLRRVAPGARIAARCSTVGGVLLNMKSGVGVGVLPSHIGDGETDLVCLLGPLAEPLTAYYLLAHPDLHGTPRVRAFFDFMIEEIAQFRPLLTGRGS
jgi:DNA-binding transcriptional LysR family regulator